MLWPILELSQIQMGIYAKCLLYTIEGNLGCGKSTLLKALSKTKLLNVYPKTLDNVVKQDLRISNNYSLVDQFLQNPQRWALTYQKQALFTRFLTIYQNKPKFDEVVFMQRGVQAQKNIITEMLRREGKLNQMELDLYEQYYTDLDTLFKFKYVESVYLRTDPKKCLERIRKRGNKEDQNVTLPYLEQMHELYEKFYGSKNNVLTIDGNEQFQTDPISQRKIMRQLQSQIIWSSL